MKQAFRLSAILFSISILTVTALAENTTYRLDNLGISIELPSEIYVLTRDIKSDQPGLELTGMTAEEYVKSLEDTNTYLEALGEDWGIMSIVMNDIGNGNINELNELEIQQVISGIEASGTAETQCYKHDVYQHKQEKFLRFFWHETQSPTDQDTRYILQYYTVCDGKAINIYFDFTRGEIDENKEAMARLVIDSIIFYDTHDAGTLNANNMQFISIAIYFSAFGIILLLFLAVKRSWKRQS